MKKLLLLTFIGSLFATGAAFAHCGSCGAGDEAHSHGDKAAECCSDKPGECCKDKAKCKSECKHKHMHGKKCCGDKPGECCKSECKKEEKAKAETAAAKSGACCPAMTTSGKAA